MYDGENHLGGSEGKSTHNTQEMKRERILPEKKRKGVGRKGGKEKTEKQKGRPEKYPKRPSLEILERKREKFPFVRRMLGGGKGGNIFCVKGGGGP